jgi:hypothetical protein
MEHFIIDEHGRRRAVGGHGGSGRVTGGSVAADGQGGFGGEAWMAEHKVKYRKSQQFVKRVGISAVTAASLMLALAVGYTIWHF